MLGTLYAGNVQVAADPFTMLRIEVKALFDVGNIQGVYRIGSVLSYTRAARVFLTRRAACRDRTPSLAVRGTARASRFRASRACSG